MNSFKVGDKVRLTGSLWAEYNGYEGDGSFDPEEIHYVTAVDRDGNALAGAAGVIHGSGPWAAEVVHSPIDAAVRGVTVEDYNGEPAVSLEDITKVSEIADKFGILASASLRGQEEVATFATKVHSILSELGELLIEKNKAYGNAALDPIRVFSSADSAEQIRVRIDDKLSRLKRGNNYGDEDTLKDLMGYLVLLQIAEGEK